MNAGNVNGHSSRHLDDNNNNSNSNGNNNTGTQPPAGRVHAAVAAADQPDWALAAVPDGLNATGLLAEDLEDYAAGGKTEIVNDSVNRRITTDDRDVSRVLSGVCSRSRPFTFQSHASRSSP